jgi:hypothetical protein
MNINFLDLLFLYENLELFLRLHFFKNYKNFK